MLERAGLACPVQQLPVRIGHRTLRLDLSDPDRRVAIEFDGWDTHRTFAAFHADRDRLRRLAAAGWTVVPVTARTSATALVRDVAAVLANCADSTGT